MIKPKIGDVVRMKPCVVERIDEDGFVWVRSACYKSSLVLALGEIEKILPRPLAVGDRVDFCDSLLYVGVILAIEGGTAWIKRPDGANNTYSLSVLRHVEETQPLPKSPEETKPHAFKRGDPVKDVNSQSIFIGHIIEINGDEALVEFRIGSNRCATTRTTKKLADLRPYDPP